MNKRVFYKVSWISGGRAEEGRRFEEWGPAADFYAELVADPRCDRATLEEVAETEVRCFEREAGRRAPARPPGARDVGPSVGKSRSKR